MIVVAGTAPIDPTKREAAKTVLKKMMDATLQEEGCITYQFLFNPWNEGEVRVFEEWASQEALDAHFQTTHMAEFRQELPKFVTGNFDIKLYVVTDVKSM